MPQKTEIILKVPMDCQTHKSLKEFAETHTEGDVGRMASILLQERLFPCGYDLSAQGNMVTEGAKHNG